MRLLKKYILNYISKSLDINHRKNSIYANSISIVDITFDFSSKTFSLNYLRGMRIWFWRDFVEYTHVHGNVVSWYGFVSFFGTLVNCYASGHSRYYKKIGISMFHNDKIRVYDVDDTNLVSCEYSQANFLLVLWCAFCVRNAFPVAKKFTDLYDSVNKK
jgi:hypothetical protein